jgi:hypothetical protein
MEINLDGENVAFDDHQPFFIKDLGVKITMRDVPANYKMDEFNEHEFVTYNLALLNEEHTRAIVFDGNKNTTVSVDRDFKYDPQITRDKGFRKPIRVDNNSAIEMDFMADATLDLRDKYNELADNEGGYGVKTILGNVRDWSIKKNERADHNPNEAICLGDILIMSSWILYAGGTLKEDAIKENAPLSHKEKSLKTIKDGYKKIFAPKKNHDLKSPYCVGD